MRTVSKVSEDAKKERAKPATNSEVWLWFAAIVAVYVLLRIHALGIPLDRDEGIFGYIGQRILDGGMPYRDGFDHKPPGVFYLYALALSFIPATATGIHLFLHLYNFLTMLTLVFLMRMRFSLGHAWLCGALCYAIFSASPAIQGFTASTEMMSLLPITLSLAAAITAERKRIPGLIVLSGASGAVAFWIKQTAASSVAFALLYVAAGSWLDDELEGSANWRHSIQNVLLWAAGALTISAGIAAYFYQAGLFQPFWYWSFTHNIVYAGQVPLGEIAASVYDSLKEVLRGDFTVILLGLAAAAWTWRRRTSDSLFIIFFLVFSLAGTLPGLSYPHYFAQLVPAVAIAGGYGLALVLSRKARAHALCYPLIATLVLVPVYIHRDYFLQSSPNAISRSFFAEDPFPESTELSQFLAGHTSEQDQIFIWGSEPQILLQAHRRSATPFAMVYPLTRQYPRYLEFQEQAWEDVTRSRPAYILLVTNVPTSILWDGQAKLDILNRLYDLVQNHYRVTAIMPVRNPQGRLVIATDGASPAIAADQPNIYVCQRVDN